MDALTLAERADELASRHKTLNKEFNRIAWQIVRAEAAAIPELVQRMREIAHDAECLDAEQQECYAAIKEERHRKHEEMLKAHEQAKTLQEIKDAKRADRVQFLKDKQAREQSEQLEKARQILLQVRQNPMERPPSVVMIESGSYKARSCFPKIQYKDVGQADKAMNLLLMSGVSDCESGDLNTYTCGDCGFWHVGHITKEKTDE